ncbi:hypothetical protein D3C81_864680 [compost metagenome]
MAHRSQRLDLVDHVGLAVARALTHLLTLDLDGVGDVLARDFKLPLLARHPEHQRLICLGRIHAVDGGVMHQIEQLLGLSSVLANPLPRRLSYTFGFGLKLVSICLHFGQVVGIVVDVLEIVGTKLRQMSGRQRPQPRRALSVLQLLRREVSQQLLGSCQKPLTLQTLLDGIDVVQRVRCRQAEQPLVGIQRRRILLLDKVLLAQYLSR